MSAAATAHGRFRTVLEMIKFEHSVFALPFALTGALLAARFTAHGWPTWKQLLWIVVAMVSARSAAMTINRLADLRYDKANPRTAQRALATGALSTGFAWLFTLAAIAVFLTAAWQLNPVAFKLAPVALSILFFLFLHQALHQLVSSLPRLRAWHLSRRSLDRHHRPSRPAHAHPLRRRHALGRRLRCPVRLPGRRLR